MSTPTEPDEEYPAAYTHTPPRPHDDVCQYFKGHWIASIYDIKDKNVCDCFGSSREEADAKAASRVKELNNLASLVALLAKARDELADLNQDQVDEGKLLREIDSALERHSS